MAGVSNKVDISQAFLSATEYRQYAYFRVTSDLPLGHVGDVLGLEPIRYWDKSDEFVRGGKSFTRRTSHWSLESGCRETEPLAAHLEALLGVLEPRSGQLAVLTEQFECAVVCVVYGVQSCGFRLPPDLLRRLGTLELNLEFDAYEVADPHDEIENLRSLLGPAQNL